MQERMFYAAFVGINAYPQGALSGCIKDVLELDLLFREQCAQQTGVRYQPVYYLAPNTADASRLDAHESATGAKLAYAAPTFANISGPLFTHFKDAKEGDICVFYYSGHGSQIEAPPVFDRPMMETLVCVDSREATSPGARDLIDKELAYLLWKTFSGRPAHALLIMDCCHSGNNTRNLKNESDVRFRYVPSGRNKVPFSDYLGYGDAAFYTLQDGKASFKIPRYVHLAACRDEEKAQETMQGGLFTNRLVEALRAGGAGRSYRELMQGLSISVGNRADRQHPIAFALQDKDLDQQFLSPVIRPFKPFFNVRYNAREKRWKMFGGAMHGLQTGAVVRVSDGEQQAAVTLQEVLPAYAWLTLSGFNEDSLQVTAVLLRMAAPTMRVGASPALKEITGSYPYFTLVQPENAPGVQYIVWQLEDGAYVLLGVNGTMPLFKREKNALLFLENVNKVGNWLAALELKQLAPKFSPADFVFEWDVQPPDIQLPDGVELTYRGEQYPSFGLRISIHPDSRLEACYLKALYLGSRYGINGTLIRNDNNKLEKKPGHYIALSLQHGEDVYTSIPVSIHEKYSGYNIQAITDYLKIIVSDIPVNLDQYEQEDLELEGAATRDLVIPGKAGAAKDQPEWAVFTFRVNCKRPPAEQVLQPGRTVDFEAFELEAPPGFKGSAAAVPEETGKTRSMAPDLWGAAITEDVLPGKALVIHPEQPIPEGSALKLRLKPHAAAVRSLQDESLEEIVLPYGYDNALQQYVPLGYADDEGNIYIEKLPSFAERSIGGAVKLYFKKIFKPKQVNTLTVPADPKGKAVLLIHGFTGETSSMHTACAAGDAVFTYDYENLATPVAKTAELLHAALLEAGMGKGSELTIVAHGIGGLVARWLVEQIPGVQYVKRLVLVGVPSGGSSLAALTAAVSGMLTDALNMTGPVKYAVTGLAWLLKHLKLHPGTALKELQPGSALIQQLLLSGMAPGVEYKVIAGDAALIKGNIIDQAIVHLFGKERNDRAVTLKSMQAIQGLDPQAQLSVVACHHLGYFREGTGIHLI